MISCTVGRTADKSIQFFNAAWLGPAGQGEAGQGKGSYLEQGSTERPRNRVFDGAKQHDGLTASYSAPMENKWNRFT